MNYYAQTTEGIVTTVCSCDGELEGDNIIPIESYDLSLLGQKYEDGKFTPIETTE
jgi:hypothetical protein